MQANYSLVGVEGEQVCCMIQDLQPFERYRVAGG